MKRQNFIMILFSILLIIPQMGNVKADDLIDLDYYQNTFVGLDGISETESKLIFYGRRYVIKEDGSLWGWGSNEYGELGDGTCGDGNEETIDNLRYVPVYITDNVARVYITGFGGMLIKTDGSLWLWGKNDDGILGDGSYSDKLKPVKILDDVVKVDTCLGTTMALKSDGSLWSWGRAPLGNGKKNDSATPVKISDNVVDIAITDEANFFLKDNKELWGFGLNTGGGLGIGGVENSYPDGDTFIMGQAKLKPVKILDNVIEIAVPPASSDDNFYFNKACDYDPYTEYAWGYKSGVMYALKSDNTLWSWFGMDKEHSVPSIESENISNLDNIDYVSGAQFRKIIDGKLYDSFHKQDEDDFTNILVDSNVKTVFNSNFHYIKEDGSLWYYRVKSESKSSSEDIEEDVQSGTVYKKKELDNVDVCYRTATGIYALKKDKTLWYKGNNENGELGDGTIATKVWDKEDKDYKFKKIMDNVNSYFIIDRGTYPNRSHYTYVIKEDGSLWGWGFSGIIGLPTAHMIGAKDQSTGDDLLFSNHLLGIAEDKVEVNSGLKAVKIMDGLALPGSKIKNKLAKPNKLKSPSYDSNYLNTEMANKLYELGLFQGKSSTEFMPALEDQTTAAEAITLIGRALKWQVNKDAVSSFTDVPDWAVPYTEYAKELGITSGVGDGKFGVDQISGKRMFTWFLAALGEDKADVWNNTETYSDKYNIKVPSSALRNDVVYIIHEGIKHPTVGEATPLIDSLSNNK